MTELFEWGRDRLPRAERVARVTGIVTVTLILLMLAGYIYAGSP